MTMAVELWWTERGSGAPFVLLHPGGSDARALVPLLDALGDGYRLITPEQRAHGHTPDAGELSFDAMADDTVAFIESLGVGAVHLLGYSDGAIVALYVALARPDLVTDLVFAAAPTTVEGWHGGVLGVEPPESMADAYAEVSPDGRDHWPVVVEKMAQMHADGPHVDDARLRELTTPTFIVLGDDDQVRLEHAVDVYLTLPNGELAVIPRSTHGFLVEKPGLFARIVREFHADHSSVGVAPLRRRPW
jgi:pimeloyl-ACP methyl ester carboxylesterase